MSESESTPSLVVHSKVRELVRTSFEGFRVGEDFLEGLSTQVASLVGDAVARCRANDRKTLRASDL